MNKSLEQRPQLWGYTVQELLQALQGIPGDTPVVVEMVSDTGARPKERDVTGCEYHLSEYMPNQASRVLIRCFSTKRAQWKWFETHSRRDEASEKNSNHKTRFYTVHE